MGLLLTTIAAVALAFGAVGIAIFAGIASLVWAIYNTAKAAQIIYDSDYSDSAKNGAYAIIGLLFAVGVAITFGSPLIGVFYLTPIFAKL